MCSYDPLQQAEAQALREGHDNAQGHALLERMGNNSLLALNSGVAQVMSNVRDGVVSMASPGRAALMPVSTTSSTANGRVLEPTLASVQEGVPLDDNRMAVETPLRKSAAKKRAPPSASSVASKGSSAKKRKTEGTPIGNRGKKAASSAKKVRFRSKRIVCVEIN